MPNELLRRVLERMERFPEAVFWESKLRAISNEEFEQLRRQKLLRFVQTDLDEATYPCPTAAAECIDRVLMRQAGKLLAVCPCPAEAAPVELIPSDIRRCQVDVREVAERFHLVNGLTGTPSAIEDRLFFLGQSEEAGMSVAFVLAFLADEREGLPLLRQIPVLLSALRCDHFRVVCPTFEPSIQARRDLQTLNVVIVPLGLTDPCVLRLEPGDPYGPPEIDPRQKVQAMKSILTSWVSGRRPGVAEALAHVVDHVPVRDHNAAAQIVDNFGYSFSRGRLHQLLYEGRNRSGCSFCLPEGPDRIKS